MSKWLVRQALKSVRPIIERWVFERLLYLPDNELNALAKRIGGDTYAPLVKMLYHRVILHFRERFDELYKELIEK